MRGMGVGGRKREGVGGGKMEEGRREKGKGMIREGEKT